MSSLVNFSYVVDSSQEFESDSIKSSFPAGFKRARKEAGLTQKQFSDVFGVGLSSVQSWEQGRHLPEIDTIERLCVFFQCSVDYLLGKTDHREPSKQMVEAYTGLSVDAVQSLQSFRHDTQAMEILNYLLSDRLLLQKLVLLFATEFKDSVDPMSDGRIIKSYFRHGDERLSVLNAIEELRKKSKDFFLEHEKDTEYAKQMCFRLLQGSADAIGINLSWHVQRVLQQSGSYTGEQIATAKEFLQYKEVLGNGKPQDND